MNLFDLIPGNDPVSKVINGVTIAVGVALLPFIGIPAGIIGLGMTYVYCAVTGKPMWTYKA